MSDQVKTCRVCGCTEDDCSGCISRTGQPCHWAADDLCSACQAGYGVMIRVKCSGSTNVASVRVGGRTYRASCTASGEAACRCVAAKAAAGLRASSWSVERYLSMSCVAARAALVLQFGGGR